LTERKEEKVKTYYWFRWAYCLLMITSTLLGLAINWIITIVSLVLSVVSLIYMLTEKSKNKKFALMVLFNIVIFGCTEAILIIRGTSADYILAFLVFFAIIAIVWIVHRAFGQK